MTGEAVWVSRPLPGYGRIMTRLCNRNMPWEYMGIAAHVLNGEESAEDILFMLKTGEYMVTVQGAKNSG